MNSPDKVSRKRSNLSLYNINTDIHETNRSEFHMLSPEDYYKNNACQHIINMKDTQSIQNCSMDQMSPIKQRSLPLIHQGDANLRVSQKADFNTQNSDILQQPSNPLKVKKAILIHAGDQNETLDPTAHDPDSGQEFYKNQYKTNISNRSDPQLTQLLLGHQISQRCTPNSSQIKSTEQLEPVILRDINYSNQQNITVSEQGASEAAGTSNLMSGHPSFQP